MHVPHHSLTDRIATIADDGSLGYRHPLPLDWNPIGALAKIIFGAMTVGDVAAGHAVRRRHGLEPGADIRRDVVVLSVVEGKRRAGQRRDARQQSDLREPSHPILHRISFRPLMGAHDSMLARLSLSCALLARSKNERSASLGMMRCEISASWFVAIRLIAFVHRQQHSDQARNLSEGCNFMNCAGLRWWQLPQRRCGSRRRAWRRSAQDACRPFVGSSPVSGRCRGWFFPWTATPVPRPRGWSVRVRWRTPRAGWCWSPWPVAAGIRSDRACPYIAAAAARSRKMRTSPALSIRTCSFGPVRAIAASKPAAPVRRWRRQPDYPTIISVPAGSPT